jgi:hypothetical protein
MHNLCYRASEGNFSSRAFWHQSTMTILCLDTNHPQTNHLWPFLGSGFSKKNWVYKEAGLFLTILSLFLHCFLHTNFRPPPIFFLTHSFGSTYHESISSIVMPLPAQNNQALPSLNQILHPEHHTTVVPNLSYPSRPQTYVPGMALQFVVSQTPRFLRVLPESYSFYLPENHAS